MTDTVQYNTWNTNLHYNKIQENSTCNIIPETTTDKVAKANRHIGKQMCLMGVN